MAALGEIPPAEAKALDEHLAGCETCRQIQSEYQALQASLIPAAEGDELARIDALKAATREAVFAGLKDVRPQLPAAIAASESKLRERAQSSSWTAKWVLVSGLAFTVFGFWLGARYERKKTGPEKVVIQVPTAVPGPMPLVQYAAATPPNEQVTEQLAAEKGKNDSLQQVLMAKDRELEKAAHDRTALLRQIDADAQALSNTQVQLATKNAEVKQVEDVRASDTANLVALRYQVQELTDRLNAQSNALKQEKDLLASGQEIRDIIGARNLHIVDVYDTDAAGKTKKAFARAFYTEGRSLVFYAYDLPPRAEEGTYKYVAWGQKNGGKATIMNLGILINDDKGQKRWVLSFSDPKVLAEIDSVFITLEPNHRDATKPSGKRMLTAYLSTQVNHP